MAKLTFEIKTNIPEEVLKKLLYMRRRYKKYCKGHKIVPVQNKLSYKNTKANRDFFERQDMRGLVYFDGKGRAMITEMGGHVLSAFTFSLGRDFEAIDTDETLE